jgi:hypothetical protein
MTLAPGGSKLSEGGEGRERFVRFVNNVPYLLLSAI